MKGIYQFSWNAGRGYRLSGLFIAESKDIQKIMGETIYFGEVCGKHSEVDLDMDESLITLKTDNQEFIAKFEEIFGENFCSGINPLSYYDPFEEDDEE